jgi:hypothetical protein
MGNLSQYKQPDLSTAFQQVRVLAATDERHRFVADRQVRALLALASLTHPSTQSCSRGRGGQHA